MTRDRWSSRIIFILAAVGSAAGLGNLWRFPYLTYEYGGGAFLIPYLIALLVLGIPLLVLEFALGQKFQLAAVGSLRKLKEWGGAIGWWALGIGFMILSYYAVVMAWSLRYLFGSFTQGWSGSAEAASSYFYSTVLGITDSITQLGGFNWTLVACLLAVWVMIYFSIWKGTKSVGHVVKVTMPLPIILILVLLIRAVTLPGAGEGLLYYLTPVFSALLDPKVWAAAAGQIFFTLTLGFGVMIAYASYAHKKEDVAGNTLWTAVLNSSISILAGFVVFGTLGFLAMRSGLTVPDVVASGPGLAFVVFPQALSMMPWPTLFSILFFVVLLSLGIDSAFSLVEGSVAAFKDKTKASSMKTAFWVSLFCFAVGLLYVTGAGLYFLDIVDNFTNQFGLLAIGIMQCLLVGWTKKGEEVRDYIAKVSTWFPTTAWWWVVRLVAPLVLTVLLITNFIGEIKAPYGGGAYPWWALLIGWLAVVLPFVIGLFLNHWYGKGEGTAKKA